MPEVKNNFTGGKMNKDLDERLVPNGQYRDAMNVEVSTSESSNVGVIENILGNKRVEDLVGSEFTCVGSITDEKTNKLYWFISRYDKDVILEYDIDNDVTSPVVVDLKAGTQKAVLKFFGNIITGINIIDNLLFWSDGKGEPKKINIDTCKQGTPNIDTHTQISFSNNSFTGLAAEYVWPSKMPNFTGTTGFPDASTSDQSGLNEENHPPFVSLKDRVKVGKYIVFERRRLAAIFGIPFESLIDPFGQIRDANNQYIDASQSTDAPGNLINSGTGTNSFGNADQPNNGYVREIRHYRENEFLGKKEIRIWDNGNGTHLRYNNNATDFDFKVGDVVFGNNIKIDIEEKHITVIKPKPTKTLKVNINYQENTSAVNKIPNLFETKFPRFSYRYKYQDGEFSPMAPFTAPVFNPQYTKDTTKSLDASVLYNPDNAYDIKEPHNKAMVNSIQSVDLSNFITIDTPEDVVEVDILYKQEDSPVVYSIATIKHTDFEWHASLNYENKNLIERGVPRYSTNITSSNIRSHMPAAHGDLTSGKYTVTTENIYAALPANQLLRPWDNVPLKAKAQEVVGNRIVYGNYIQNYTIGSKPKVFVSYRNRKKMLSDFDSKGLPSIKSQRNYQVGVVYIDEFGRETPVFTSNTGATYIPWENERGDKNASKSNQLVASAVNNFPDWVEYIKFFVKENSGEYYNLAMQRAWTAKSIYELDNEEGHLWLSFPSSDRNKISEEDYIILKKKIGANENQITFENKFKVIDIKNEAPDAIKHKLVNLGTVANDSNNTLTQDDTPILKFFQRDNFRIDKIGNDTLQLSILRWTSENGQYTSARPRLAKDINPDTADIYTDLYFSWFRLADDGTVTASSKYKGAGGWVGSNGYVIKLERPIEEVDADIAHVSGNAADSTSEANLHADLVFQVERKEERQENFSGQFFVKISKNQITQNITEGNELQELNQYQVKAKSGAWYWQDDPGQSTLTNANNPHHFGSGAPYGATNYFGFYHATKQSNNDIQQAGGGNTNVNGLGGTARLTDWHVMWENVLAELNNDTKRPRFFVDAMHIASGQSNHSNYAKFNCINWSGFTTQHYQPPGFSFGDASGKESCWSYPPVKKWWTEITENELEATKGKSFMSGGAGYYQSGQYFSNSSTVFTQAGSDPNQGIITTSHLFDTVDNWTYEDDNGNNKGLQIDGFVGANQHVGRLTLFGNEAANHINCLEGFVTTNDYHAVGPRRWLSGMNGEDRGVGKDTKTYSENKETGKHFMHLSFFAPGRNLHNNTWSLSNPMLYGEDTIMDNLQGIWGGGVFTGRRAADKFGSDSSHANKHYHLAMEGNYANGSDNTYKVYKEPPGPGVGYGYNLEYRELHERQWDPTFNENGDPDNKIRDFIRNIYPGAKFRFNYTTPGAAGATAHEDTENVYTIKKVQIKKLYNHTNWRSHYNIYWNGNGGYKYDYDDTHMGSAYSTVEDFALKFLDSIDKDGDYNEAVGLTDKDSAANNYGVSKLEDLKKKIVDFGAAHNRRLCYIIELDKNPTQSSYNPVDNSINNKDAMSGDLDSDNFTDIEFLEPIQDLILSDLNKFPAIWELSPKKQKADLDIYHEASDSIPIRINKHTNSLFAPKGCKVELLNVPSNQEDDNVYLVEWDNNIATFEPGFIAGDGTNEIDYTNYQVKFIREDGSYTIAELGQQNLTGSVSGFKTNFIFKPNISSTQIEVGLPWFNCFSFGNGLESNRIRDDFNEMFITNGPKVSSITQETYQQESRSSGLIFSGLYNSNSGVNDLNQFIMAEKITKDLNPTYGSIQKLFTRNTDLVAFCEDKVIKILANKDAVFNADGNAQLTANENVLGQTVPFVGEYGIAKNPESFASESYRAYFTDSQRGAVLRLSMDGITPISKTGMHDWFRDNLKNNVSLIGSYDSYKENYNLTFSNTYTENIVFNTYFQLGAESTPIDTSVLSYITNGGVNVGGSYGHSYNTKDINTDPVYSFPVDESFRRTITVRNHPAIPVGHFQQEQNGSGTAPAAVIATATTATVGATAAVPFAEATYSNVDDSLFLARPSTTSNDLFGPTAANSYNLYSSVEVDSGAHRAKITRMCGPLDTASVSVIDESNPSSNPYFANPFGNTSVSWPATSTNSNNPTTEITAIQSYPMTYSQYNGNDYYDEVTGQITRAANNGHITFDRTHKDSRVIFTELARSGQLSQGGTNATYYNAAYPGSPSPTANSVGIYNNSIYNGDEIHIQVRIKCYKEYMVSGHTVSSLYGMNRIEPVIELVDGLNADGTPNYISPDIVQYMVSPGSASSLYETDPAINPYTKYHSMPHSGVGLATWTGYISSSASAAYADETGVTYNGFDAASNISNITNVFGNSWSGISNHWHHIHTFANGGPFVFPRTSYIDNATDDLSHAHSQSQLTSYDLVVGVSYKFRDPNQQNADGSHNGTGDGIEEVQLIQDLGIAIGNDYQTSYNIGYQLGSSGIYPMSRPIFQVKDVRVVKGYSVQAPHTDFVPANPGVQVTTYDDPTTGAIETYTEAEVLAGGGVWDPTVNGGAGGYVLNQAGTGPGANLQSINNYINSPSGGSYYHPNIPDVAVPAWVEVIHGDTNWDFNIGSIPLSANFGAYHAFNQAVMFGNARGGTTVSATKAAPGDSTNSYTGPVVSWKTPGADPGGQNPQEGNYGNSAGIFDKIILDKFGVSHNPPPPGDIGVSGGNGPNGDGAAPGEKIYTDLASPWWRIKENLGNQGSYGISYDHTGSPLETGEWYLVDIELDPTHHPSINVSPSNGGTGPVVGSYTSGGNLQDGHIAIRGVNGSSLTQNQDLSTIGGFGTNVGGNTDEHASCRLHYRTEYGTDQWVYRAVFKIESDSWVNTTTSSTLGAENINIRFYNFINNDIRVRSIIVKKVSYVNGLGTATNWLRGIYDGNGDRHIQINALTNSVLYYNDDHLCWENCKKDGNYNWSTLGQQSSWTQDLSTNPILNQGDGWLLKFELGNNPRTNSFDVPDLSVYVTGSSTDYGNYGGATNEFTGIRAYGINSPGKYEIKFKLDGTGPDGGVVKDGIEDTSITVQEYSASGYSNTYNVAENKLTFFNHNTSSLPMTCGIKNISLTQQNTIFNGGQAGSWDFDGFDSTTSQFISWQIYWDQNSDPDGRLQFREAPSFDSNFGNGNVIVCANQFIDKKINRYEQYEVSFNFAMQDFNDITDTVSDGQGVFHMYYFNAEGYGFRIDDIGDPNFTSATLHHNDYTPEAIYDANGNFLWWKVTKVVGIGDGSSNRMVYDSTLGYDVIAPGTEDYANSEYENGFGEAFRNTLVIRKDSAGESTVTGWIDNISMRRVYIPGLLPVEGSNYASDSLGEKTITFSEDVNGWTSFKSFVPEGGLSLSKKYFTFKNGYLYRHYMPMKYDTVNLEWSDCVESEAENYNLFYNHLDASEIYKSTVTALINVEPSVVKTFNTINYEGSQAFVLQPTVSESVYFGASYNSNAINGDIEGWRCLNIHTDLDSGSLNNFIKKEGKWFGYIKGGYLTNNSTIDTSKFSVQGIGFPQSVTEII